LHGGNVVKAIMMMVLEVLLVSEYNVEKVFGADAIENIVIVSIIIRQRKHTIAWALKQRYYYPAAPVEI